MCRDAFQLAWSLLCASTLRLSQYKRCVMAPPT